MKQEKFYLVSNRVIKEFNKSINKKNLEGESTKKFWKNFNKLLHEYKENSETFLTVMNDAAEHCMFENNDIKSKNDKNASIQIMSDIAIEFINASYELMESIEKDESKKYKKEILFRSNYLREFLVCVELDHNTVKNMSEIFVSSHKCMIINLMNAYI